MDDHVGIVSAMQYDLVLPLFIFDSSFYAGWTEERLSNLFDAVTDLRLSLESIGSTLVVRKGRSQDVLLALAQEIGATEIIAEEETEQVWYDLVGSVSASLSVKSLSGQKTGVKQWRAPLYDLKGVQDVPDNYKEFTRLRRRILSPLDAPTSLPALPAGIEPGKIPSVVGFISSSKAKFKESPFGEVLLAAQGQPAESLLMGKRQIINGNTQQMKKATSNGSSKGRNLLSKQAEEMPFNYVWEHRQHRDAKVEKKADVFSIKGGTEALEMLHMYMKAMESTQNPCEGMFKRIQELEKRPGSSFIAIFDRALELGILSRRRVYYEAMKYGRNRRSSSGSLLGFSKFSNSTAAEDVKSIEWHEMIQRKSRDEGSENGLKVCSWRWRGYLIQYSTLGDEGPAVVLIHGFGAFWEHYRDNIRGLAEKGNRVWGLTMVGFGRSEKPTIAYTELVLAELVRDFIIEVVKEPATLAGNSIGGYTTCVVAGLWPSLVRSLVLLNSAGQVVPNYTSLQYRKPREKSIIAKRGAQILLVYLRHLSNRLLQRCYPNRTTRVDAWLQSEVMRPSYDPGSTAVLESIFHLNPPLPMNFYIDRYNGEVLVIQGVRDPLHNATKRAAVLRANCVANITTRFLNAGHCPHDEVPDEVNALIHDWLRCSSTSTALDTANLESQFLTHEDAAGIVKGDSRLIKSDWFSYFSR
jgi:pimeloyl-ACP methyl ester carboxylesterase